MNYDQITILDRHGNEEVFAFSEFVDALWAKGWTDYHFVTVGGVRKVVEGRRPDEVRQQYSNVVVVDFRPR